MNGLRFIYSQSGSGTNPATFKALGPQGPRGFQGEIGPQGFQGFQGEIGPQGFQGEFGPQGFQGEIGPQGYIGYQGEVGPQGFQGLVGHQGAGGTIGYYGSFYDTTMQQNSGGNTGIPMRYNTTSEAFGVSILDETKILFDYNGVYNIQFSAQFDKTDSGTDEVDIWLSINGESVPYSNTRLTSVGNNDKFIASWNFVTTLNGGDYVELYWSSADTEMRIYAEGTGTNPPKPGIPSVILTAQQIMYTQVGPTGTQGFQGFQGEIGPQGFQGEIGPQGFQGEVGPQGFQGEIGPQGFQGVSGFSTNTGAQGSQGFQGEIGPQGVSGFSTNTGAQGPLGPVGGSDTQLLFNHLNSSTGSTNLTYDYNSNILNFGCNIIPTTGNTYDIGSLSYPLRSIYVSTGTVFIGPTGALLVNNNGVLSSANGFASPFVSIGSTNPGNGITLYNQSNKLYYLNQVGQSGPVSVFNQASNSTNNIFFTGGYIGIGTSTPTSEIDVVGTVKTNKVQFDGLGSIYFQTGLSTGCFIDGLRYDVTGANHYLYYNSTTKEVSHQSPIYFFSYSTGTQLFTGTNTFEPVRFDANNILYHTINHTQGSSLFTGTFDCPVVLNINYSLQIHSTSNSKETAAAALYLDGTPIAGSYRSATVLDTNGEYALTNDLIVNVPQGNHVIELRAAATNINVNIGGVPNIPAPGSSYTSVNMRCTRVL